MGVARGHDPCWPDESLGRLLLAFRGEAGLLRAPLSVAASPKPGTQVTGGQAVWASRGRTALRVLASATHPASQGPWATVSVLAGPLSVVSVTAADSISTHTGVFLLQEFLRPGRLAGGNQTKTACCVPRLTARSRRPTSQTRCDPLASLHLCLDFSWVGQSLIGLICADGGA